MFQDFDFFVENMFEEIEQILEHTVCFFLNLQITNLTQALGMFCQIFFYFTHQLSDKVNWLTFGNVDSNTAHINFEYLLLNINFYLNVVSVDEILY